jgi:mono/diheme cytochrome c family protein
MMSKRTMGQVSSHSLIALALGLSACAEGLENGGPRGSNPYVPSGGRAGSGDSAASGGSSASGGSPASGGSGGASGGSAGNSSGVGGAGATAGSGAVDAGTGSVPQPPDYAIPVPPYEQPAGDPDRGYDYLINGDYQRLGPDLAAFKAAQPPIRPEDRLPGRRGDNVDLSYMFNAAKSPDGTRVAAVNCLSCHASQLQGKLTVGLGRPQRMVRLDDVNVLGIALANPFALGSSASTLGRLLGGVYLGVMDVFPYLASHRDPQTLVWSEQQRFNPDAGVQGWVDIPPWWRAKKKNGLYSNGSGRGVQGHHMSFMSIFSVENTAEAAVIERNFDDVAAFIRSIKPPPFPGSIDRGLAAQGERTFLDRCATCHGTYGANWTYPNVIIPYEEVGTDPSLATGHWMTPTVEWYSKSWYAREGKSWLQVVEGYYAPPLDGIWATAPFFHNGSVPTLDGVIDPKKRPALWTSDMTADDYDLQKVGWIDKPWEFTVTLDQGFGRFDTNVPGNSNQGHTYGADLGEEAQRALLEYLKTL